MHTKLRGWREAAECPHLGEMDLFVFVFLAYEAMISINKQILTGGIIRLMIAKGKSLMHWDISVKVKEQNESLFLIHLSESLIFCSFALSALFNLNIPLFFRRTLLKCRWCPWIKSSVCVCVLIRTHISEPILHDNDPADTCPAVWLFECHAREMMASPPPLSKKTSQHLEWLTYLLLLWRSPPPTTTTTLLPPALRNCHCPQRHLVLLRMGCERQEIRG